MREESGSNVSLDIILHFWENRLFQHLAFTEITNARNEKNVFR